MACISVPTAVLAGGALSAGGGVLSGILGANAAGRAATLQSNAATRGQDIQMSEFNTIQNLLAPFVSAGQSATAELGRELPSLTAKFQPTIQQLEGTPGYQFTLDQGLKATQNSYAAQGLASSGAALKGASNYAEGLAGTTFQQQFQNYLTQNQQIYNMLAGQQTLGANAAAQTGTLGAGITSNITNLLTGGAAVQAGGVVGATNAITGAIGNIAGAGQNTALLLALNNAGMFGPGPAANANTGGLT